MNEQRYTSPAMGPQQPQMNPPYPAPHPPQPPQGTPISPQQYAAIMGEPKTPLLELTRRDTAFAVAAVAVSVFASVFGLFGGMALGYTLTVAAMLILLVIYFAKGGRLSVLTAVSGALALSLGAVFLCTSNGSVRFFALVVGFLLTLVCCHGIAVGPTAGNRQTAGIFYNAAASLGGIGISVKSLFSDKNGDKKAIGKALIGLLCSLPVLMVILPLLLSSDDAFRGMMNSLFSDAVGTILKTAFGLGLAFPLIGYGFSLRHRSAKTLGESKFGGIENVYVISFLSTISLCYLLYLFSQLAYFFSAFRGFLPEGDITVAQYARKGFFEMCAIAVINLLIVFAALLLSKKKDGKVCHGTKALATFIALFTLVIIATAVSKMVLYIGSFGMTVLRLTTSAFMVFLAVVFLAVILRIYLRRVNLIKTALLTAGVILVVLGVVNVNAVCARYNYEAYRNGTLKEIDVVAMYDLGDEGVPYLTRLVADTDPTVAQQALVCLAHDYWYNYFEFRSDDNFMVKDLKEKQQYSGFSHYSLPRAAAYEAMYEFADENPWLAPLVREYATLYAPGEVISAEENPYPEDTYVYE